MATHTDEDKGVITLEFKGCSNFPAEMPRALEGIMSQDDWRACIIRINRVSSKKKMTNSLFLDFSINECMEKRKKDFFFRPGIDIF